MGIFNIRRRLGGKTIDIHTGGIHGLWRLMKESVPHALSSIRKLHGKRADVCALKYFSFWPQDATRGSWHRY